MKTNRTPNPTFPETGTAQQPSTTAEPRMPVFFIPHGAGPCFFMDWNPPDTWHRLGAWLESIAATLPGRPWAIVLVSGHWLEIDFRLTGHPRPPLIYDYHGFPPHTYELTYPAPGQPALAASLSQRLQQAGLGASVDPARGYDHGMFIPLKLMFPQADVPVIQLSLRQDMDPGAHLDVGRALAGLRDEGVLIIGSGMSFHNMRGYGDPRFTPISAEFDDWLTTAVSAAPTQRDTLLRDWTKAPHARLCHPPRAEEHLLPLLVAAGAGADSPGRKAYSEVLMATTISAFRFG